MWAVVLAFWQPLCKAQILFTVIRTDLTLLVWMKHYRSNVRDTDMYYLWAVYATNTQYLEVFIQSTARCDILPSSTSANTRFLVEWRLQAMLMAGYDTRMKADQTKPNYRNDKTGLYERYFKGYFFAESKQFKGTLLMLSSFQLHQYLYKSHARELCRAKLIRNTFIVPHASGSGCESH